ncbi:MULTISPECIES: hypothetical protein [unclassified Leptolyngbya]|uniref:hypothetical protein n=1 Tax=unclassified Leptolyngbya TaxID=2650499 RepID=UPI00168910AA|nr:MULTISPECIES: hypothetical protein [unclassified Leptolyngbya]MBD1911423.1 hypothetical protein [Leptolyngbya sp. FACHB-8]MBD2159049.1 hypothetical protein [Leptolyngbya sp. FACHB-16]
MAALLAGDGDSLEVGNLALTVDYLKNESTFLDAITIQLYQKLLERYGEELDQEITSDTIFTNIKDLADDWLEQQHRWPQLVQELRSNLVMRALQDMERDLGDAVLQSLDWEAFNRMLLQYLGNGDRDRLNARLAQLESFHGQRIAEQIVQSLNLEQQPFSTIKRMLRLGTEAPRIVSTPEVEEVGTGPIAEIPSEFPVVSQEDAEGVLYFSDRLQTDLWDADLRNVAFLRYQSRHNRNAYLEHYVTNPSDLIYLPWEMTEQLLQKFGLSATRLHLLFCAFAMQHEQTWHGSFQLDMDDILPLLDGTRPPRMGRATRQNQIAGLAYALSCLLVKMIWGETATPLIQTPVAKLWDILIEPQGNLDWSSGRIEQPEAIHVLVRPGLWVEGIAQRSEGRLGTALQHFGRMAVLLLQRQAFTNDLALRLLIYLMLDTRLQASSSNPHEYEVRRLLSIGLSSTEPIDDLSLSEAQGLFDQWHQTLSIFAALGWQPRPSGTGAVTKTVLNPSHFYRSPYPRWLDPTQEIRKPKGWVGNWLDQRLALYPPLEATALGGNRLEVS